MIKSHQQLCCYWHHCLLLLQKCSDPLLVFNLIVLNPPSLYPNFRCLSGVRTYSCQPRIPLQCRWRIPGQFYSSEISCTNKTPFQVPSATARLEKLVINLLLLLFKTYEMECLLCGRGEDTRSVMPIDPRRWCSRLGQTSSSGLWLGQRLDLSWIK